MLKVISILTGLAGEISAVDALRQACQSLKMMCAHMKETFGEAYREHGEQAACADSMEP